MIRRKLNDVHSDTLRRITSYASMAVAIILILSKLVAYYATDSIAMLSSLVDSSIDLLASGITAFGIARALLPPDRDHRFGHGKAESLAALAQAAFIIGSSALLSIEAVNRFVSPKPIENQGVGYVVMGLAIGLTAVLLLLQTYTVRRTKSLAIAADRLHYVGDIAINLAVVATLAIQKMANQTWIDPAFALGIAAIMCYGAIRIFKTSMNVLMDSELPEKDREAILALTRTVSGVLGVHDLRTRTDSGHPIVEIHVEMAATITLKKSHDIAEAVMARIEAAYPGADILVHQDPAGIEEKRLDLLIEKNDPPKK